ncbi:hypothetical protein [Deinococcus humi]|uniref:Uncharacterized protein n=1 Tax=Deinococcus humi TaxID=662880 RepID=A0A7W8JYR6_9DEIO|nr:hypothetical protein [Deinococcus humi]MBB5365707.1 hypothetical protein [Deinococcus humi]GGO38504.1 hypothetical protein GCM10008949_45170 [Deinococcus humi]
MSSLFEQEIGQLHRFQAGLRSSPQTVPVNAMEQQIDEVCARVRQHVANIQAGTSLLNVRRSGNDDVNTAKAQLAADLDQLIQTLSAPTEVVADVLDLYLPGYAREGYPVHHATRRAAISTVPALHPGVLGEVSVLNRWLVPADSPVRPQLEAWVELHDALQAVDAEYSALDSAQSQLLSEVDSDQVLDADLDWDGTFLTQVLTVTHLGSGEVQVLNLTDVTLDGDTWIVTVEGAVPHLSTDAVVRLSTTDGAFSGDLPHRQLDVQDAQLRVMGVSHEAQERLRALTVVDVAQLTVLDTVPVLDNNRTLN